MQLKTVSIKEHLNKFGMTPTKAYENAMSRFGDIQTFLTFTKSIRSTMKLKASDKPVVGDVLKINHIIVGGTEEEQSLIESIANMVTGERISVIELMSAIQSYKTLYQIHEMIFPIQFVDEEADEEKVGMAVLEKRYDGVLCLCNPTDDMSHLKVEYAFELFEEVKKTCLNEIKAGEFEEIKEMAQNLLNFVEILEKEELHLGLRDFKKMMSASNSSLEKRSTHTPHKKSEYVC